jgi:hypothetical protein
MQYGAVTGTRLSHMEGGKNDFFHHHKIKIKDRGVVALV